jgi:hypothetical protein
MVADVPVPEKRAIRGSNPPDPIVCPIALTPPPKDQVWTVTVLVDERVKDTSKTSFGAPSVPV